MKIEADTQFFRGQGEMTTYTLGTFGWPGTLTHDASAALFKDGALIAAVEEERFTRHRHAHGEGPFNAIRFCLKRGGISESQVDFVTYGWATCKPGKHSGQRISEWVTKCSICPTWLFETTDLRKHLPSDLNLVNHHAAHLGAARYISGAPSAAGLILDGRGEAESISLYEIEGTQIRTIRSYGIGLSLGFMYAAASKFAGLTLDGSGKLMGLAPYGRPLPHDPLITVDTESGRLETAVQGRPEELHSLWIQYFRDHFFPYSKATHDGSIFYANFAATVQLELAQAIVDLVRYLRQRTQASTLLLGGGVALNCNANDEVIRTGLFEDVQAFPASNDAGCSVGSAVALLDAIGIPLDRNLESRRNPFLGPSEEPSLEDPPVVTTPCREEPSVPSSLVETIVHDLQEDRVVGLFRGPAEFGPRALGARSLVASAAHHGNLIRINRLKGREIWRPLAPVILQEDVPRLFDVPADDSMMEYMLRTVHVRSKWVRRVPAVVHADQTTRPQVVRGSGFLRQLLMVYRERSGLPLLINTSFNMRGLPMVNTPDEAMEMFRLCDGMHGLLLGERYLTRDQPTGSVPSNSPIRAESERDISEQNERTSPQSRV